MFDCGASWVLKPKQKNGVCIWTGVMSIPQTCFPPQIGLQDYAAEVRILLSMPADCFLKDMAPSFFDHQIDHLLQNHGLAPGDGPIGPSDLHYLGFDSHFARPALHDIFQNVHI